MPEPLKVAVLGASGIGRHHANWHAHLGSSVVAFLGSAPERLEPTASRLRDTFGFSGRGYTCLDELLETEGPDLVDICTPNGRHADEARRALAAGCHVLCEKPMVWDADGATSLARARALGPAIRDSRGHLGLCTQYAAAFEQYSGVYPDAAPASASTFDCVMETLSKGRQRDAEAIWVDMGPHPLSLILAAWPEARVVADSLQTRLTGRQAAAAFTVEQDGHRCDCRITVRDLDEGPLERYFAFDGARVDLGSRAGADGVFRSIMTAGDTEDVGQDLMHRLLQQFTEVAWGRAEAPLVSYATALRNLELLVQVLDAA